jgi:hypothetical protein
MAAKPSKSVPAFGIELRRAGRSVVRVFTANGELLWQGPTAHARLALPELPMAPPMLVAESELRCLVGQYPTDQIEGWDHVAVDAARRAGLL